MIQLTVWAFRLSMTGVSKSRMLQKLLLFDDWQLREGMKTCNPGDIHMTSGVWWLHNKWHNIDMLLWNEVSILVSFIVFENIKCGWKAYYPRIFAYFLPPPPRATYLISRKKFFNSVLCLTYFFLVNKIILRSTHVRFLLYSKFAFQYFNFSMSN